MLENLNKREKWNDLNKGIRKIQIRRVGIFKQSLLNL